MEIQGYTAHFCSRGKGKGVATYCRNEYKKVREIKKENHQILVVANSELSVVNIYKSSSSDLPNLFINDLIRVLGDDKETIIVGDFNICFREEENHPVITKLKSMKYVQKVMLPTHIQGRYIDHVYHFSPSQDGNKTEVEVIQFGQFYTDHDMMLVRIPQR